MRAEQWIGLSPAAKAWLQMSVGEQTVEVFHSVNGAAPTKVGEYTEVPRELHRVQAGALGGEHPLYKYVTHDGIEIIEDIQLEPWSSGPMTFVALRGLDGKWVIPALWTRDAIDEVEIGLVELDYDEVP